MKFRNHFLMTATAMMLMTGIAAAETTSVTTTTVVTPQERDDINMVEFSAFDYNHDGILSMEEVGEKLFYLFDRDGNEIIDNIEFTQNSVLTIAPMKKETITLVDYYNDGIIEQSTYTYETFLQESQLSRFADDLDGLSPKEFVDTSFLIMDDNHDKAIDLQEWKEAYIAMVIPANAEQERYNN